MGYTALHSHLQVANIANPTQAHPTYQNYPHTHRPHIPYIPHLQTHPHPNHLTLPIAHFITPQKPTPSPNPSQPYTPHLPTNKQHPGILGYLTSIMPSVFSLNVPKRSFLSHSFARFSSGCSLRRKLSSSLSERYQPVLEYFNTTLERYNSAVLFEYASTRGLALNRWTLWLGYTYSTVTNNNVWFWHALSNPNNNIHVKHQTNFA